MKILGECRSGIVLLAVVSVSSNALAVASTPRMLGHSTQAPAPKAVKIVEAAKGPEAVASEDLAPALDPRSKIASLLQAKSTALLNNSSEAVETVDKILEEFNKSSKVKYEATVGGGGLGPLVRVRKLKDGSFVAQDVNSAEDEVIICPEGSVEMDPKKCLVMTISLDYAKEIALAPGGRTRSFSKKRLAILTNPEPHGKTETAPDVFGKIRPRFELNENAMEHADFKKQSKVQKNPKGVSSYSQADMLKSLADRYNNLNPTNKIATFDAYKMLPSEIDELKERLGKSGEQLLREYPFETDLEIETALIGK